MKAENEKVFIATKAKDEKLKELSEQVEAVSTARLRGGGQPTTIEYSGFLPLPLTGLCFSSDDYFGRNLLTVLHSGLENEAEELLGVKMVSNEEFISTIREICPKVEN